MLKISRLALIATVTAIVWTIVSVAGTAQARPARGTVLLSDGFEAAPVATWTDGGTYGNWKSVYNGYGTNGVVVDGTTRVLSQAPMASTSAGETHASLVTSVRSFSGNQDITVRLKTVKQLRTPTPNPWETAWVAWNYAHDHAFYYLALKTNGWELAKVDNTQVDPAGPACVWPSYTNCKYAGAQRYLLTGSSPAYPVGAWYTVRIVQIGGKITVRVGGVQIASFTDLENPYRAGSLALYNEDASVRFDDVMVKSA